MPLLVSPIDGETPMQQIRRDGIEIDRCPVSGGVWLDKGELEKLLSAVQSAAAEERVHYAEYRQQMPHKPMPTYGHGQYRDDDYDDYHHKKYGKKSKMRSIFDMFD
jgi:uncharacterized protein